MKEDEIKEVEMPLAGIEKEIKLDPEQPDPTTTTNPKSKTTIEKYRDKLISFINSPVFISASFTLILLNTIVLAMDSYKITPSTENFLITCNVVFTIIFAFEMVIKLIAFGVIGYVRDAFNLFDGILVVVSLVGMIYEMVSSGSISGTNVLTVFRSIRVLRIFKLASRSQNLLILLEAIRKTVKEILNYLFLLCLYIFIMALLGMEFYAYRVRVDHDGNPLTDAS